MSLSSRLQLTGFQQEILCEILADSTNDFTLIKERQELLQTLVKRYEKGDTNTLRNPEKAKNYKKQLQPLAEQEAINFFEVKSKLITLHQFFTWSRLLLARLNKSLSFFNKGFLPKIFNVLGLSFAIELLIDLITIIVEVTDPIKSDYELGLSPIERIFHRLKLAFSDTERLSRMTNDALWFAINLTTFLLLGPIALIVNPILNIAGNGLDVIHDGFFWWLNSKKLVDLSCNVNKQIITHHTVIHSLERTLDDAIKAQYPLTIQQYKQANNDVIKLDIIREQTPAKDNRLITDTRTKLNTLRKENASLKQVAISVENKITQAESAGARIIIGACLILVGSVLITIFTATGIGIPLAAIIGGGIVLVGGCVMRGFGPMVYDKLCGAVKSIRNIFNPPIELLPEFVPKSPAPAISRDSYLMIKKELQANCSIEKQLNPFRDSKPIEIRHKQKILPSIAKNAAIQASSAPILKQHTLR